MSKDNKRILKTTWWVIAIAVGIILAIATTVYAVTRPTKTSGAWVKAQATHAATACLQPNSKLTISKSTRDTIEQDALGYLYDVPAGTNVDVKLATYTGTTVTGSDYYPAKYGHYNFAMTKQSDGWHFTDFKHCY